MPRFNQIINKECSRCYMFATYFDSVYTKVLICKTWSNANILYLNKSL